MKIVFFGNCQAYHTKVLISESLKDPKISCTYLSSTRRFGEKKSNHDILEAIRTCDILVYQPLSNKYGTLSSDYIESNFPDVQKVSFPYIFNSGITSLIHAPQGGGGDLWGDIW